MNNKAFRMAHGLFNDHWMLRRRWQGVFGFSLLFLAFFSLYNQAHSHQIDTTGGQPLLVDTQTAQPLSISRPEEFSTDTLLIGVSPDATVSDVQKILQHDGMNNLVVEKVWPEFGIALVRLPEQSASPVAAAGIDAIQRLEKYRQTVAEIPAIRYVDYNGWISVPPSPGNSSEDTRQFIAKRAAHFQQNPDAQEVVVALPDSGYDITGNDPSAHSLWENQAERNGVAGVDDDENGFVDDFHGWDWITNGPVGLDPSGHGTAIGNMILDISEQQNADRDLIKLQLFRILREDGKGEIADLIDALVYAMRKGTPIVNFSLVSYYHAPSLEQAIKIAHGKGMLIIAATGNFSTRLYWPAQYSETWSVEAFRDTEVTISRCPGNPGPDVAVDVDSTNIETTLPWPTQATPIVTAVAALIMSQHPDWSNETIMATILSTADYSSGMPLLNIEAALNPSLIFDKSKLQFGSMITGTAKTVSLQVTNITTQTETYQLDTFEPVNGCNAAIDVTFEPQSITLEANQSITVEVTYDTAHSQALGQSNGFISINSPEHDLILPVLVDSITEEPETREVSDSLGLSDASLVSDRLKVEMFYFPLIMR